MGNENFAFLLLLSIYRFVIEGRLVEWRCLSSVFGPCFCLAVLTCSVLSSFGIVLMGKRELVLLLSC